MNLDVIKGIVDNSGDAALLFNNANKASERIPVQRDMVAGEVSKHIALTEILTKEVADAHISGDIHFHDLDYSPLFGMFNCMLVDIKGMFEKGFEMGNAAIEEPKSISTAASVTAQIIAQVASHTYGGTSINRIDEVLAPYVRASYNKHLAEGTIWCKGHDSAVAYAIKMTGKETYDAFQALEYEINTLHTANGQTPFTTLGFGMGTSWESRLIQRAILDVRRAGLGKSKRTAVFPKLVFGIRDGVNLKQADPNYDIKQLALKCASERMYPDILNYDETTRITGAYKVPMGCRSFLSGCPSGEIDGRCNLGVVSINLPRIAIEADGCISTFFSILDDRARIAKAALDIRVNRLRKVKAKTAPILYTQGACGVRLDPEEYVFDKVFGNQRASISLGYIGLHEAAIAMFNEGPYDYSTANLFCMQIVKCLRSYCDNWKVQDNLGYGLYSTPSESLCDRFCKLDVQRFGEQVGVTDKGYYTNSFHLDVNRKVAPEQKINFEAPYHNIASAGHISYVEFPDMKRFIPALEYIWDYTYSRLPYFGTNTPVDICLDCSAAVESKATEEGFACPVCGSTNVEVTRRVCGYLGAPNARPFNPGKQLEVTRRVKHT